MHPTHVSKQAYTNGVCEQAYLFILQDFFQHSNIAVSFSFMHIGELHYALLHT